MFKEGFALLGVNIDVYAPNRFTDGYGLNPKNMKKFAEKYDLLISGDTGIRAFEGARVVKEIGKAELIVTDHHEPLEGSITGMLSDKFEKRAFENPAFVAPNLIGITEDEKKELLYSFEVVPCDAVIEMHGDHFIALPDSLTVVNPKRLADHYPNKSLSGVAVVFKVFQAIFIAKGMDMKPLYNLLDVVATGLVADLVPHVDVRKTKTGDVLDFEVRTMTSLGLQVMNNAPKPWVKAIAEANSIKGEINAGHIGFRIGPILNAPGRLEDPMPAVQLLLEKDQNAANEIAKQLKAINSERQEQTSEYEAVIEDLLLEGEDRYDYGIVVQSDKFHIGIAGLVAGKLCEHFYRPTIALAPLEKDGKVVLKGSARSIPGVHVLRMLDFVKEEIGDFVYGGHEQAAGLTLEPERFDAFWRAFRKAAMIYDESVFTPQIFYDADVAFEEVDYGLLKYLKMFEPYGEGNRKALFKASGVKLSMLKPIMEGKGAKLTFKQGRTVLNGISFKNGEFYTQKYQDCLRADQECLVDVLFSPELNVWNGQESIQLQVEDIHFA
jgi:single-stranded-DNA-specific exonuclease